LLLAAVPAGAADVPYAATADAAGVTISLEGDVLAALGITAASLTDSAAAASAAPAIVAGGSIGGREAASDGPLDEDGGCEVELDAPLGDFLEPDSLCGEAIAHLDDGMASAVGGVFDDGLGLDLDASELEPLLELLGELGIEEAIDGVLADLDAALAAAYAELIEGVVEEYEALHGFCLEDLEAHLTIGGLSDLIADLREATSPGDVIGALTLIETALELAGADYPDTCTSLGELAEVLAAHEFPDDLEGVVGRLASGAVLDLLDGLGGGAELTLLATVSDTVADDGGVEAYAASTDWLSVVLWLDVPDGLSELVDDAVADALAEVPAAAASLDEGLAALAAVLGAESIELPFPTLQGVFDELGVDLVALLGGPLLEVGLLPGWAGVAYDGSAGDFADVHAEAALLVLDGTLFDLAGLGELDEQLSELVGEVDEALLAASPLAEVLDVRLLATSVDEAADVAGLPGQEAVSGGASLALLGALDGDAVLQVDLSAATAAVGVGEAEGVTPPVQPADGAPTLPAPGPGDDAPRRGTLPDTGGGAALLGLAAIGAAAALRRRAD
jgi:hypothetical protein